MLQLKYDSDESVDNIFLNGKRVIGGRELWIRNEPTSLSVVVAKNKKKIFFLRNNKRIHCARKTWLPVSSWLFSLVTIMSFDMFRCFFQVVVKE